MTLRLRAAALAGTAAVLAAGALVGTATTAAQAAAPSGVGYVCHNGTFNADVPVVVGISGFPSELATGQSVGASTLDLPVTFTLTREVLDGMAAKGINQVGVTANDFALTVGTTSVGVTGASAPKTAAPATGDLVLSAAGKNAAFIAPTTEGVYDVTLPSSFNATVPTNLIDLPVSCAITDPSAAKVGSTDVQGPAPVMQDSTTTATAPKSVKQGKAVTIAVKVATDAPATGSVTAVEGAKKLGSATLSNGTAKIVLKKLKPGTHNITVKYAGDPLTNASSSKAFKVKVVKKK